LIDRVQLVYLVGDVQHHDADDTTHDDRADVRKDREHHEAHGRGNHARHHEESDGVQRHRLEGFDLLANLHGSEFRGDRGACEPREDDGGDERAEFACDRHTHKVRHLVRLPKLAEARSGLQCQDDADAA